MEAKQNFGKLIFLLAKECDKELPRDIIPIYQSMANKYGYEVLSAAVEFTIRQRKSRDPFPTPFELGEICERILGKSEGSAEEISGRILKSVSKFGRINSEAAREYMGEVGWEVVQLSGGWSTICSMKVDQTNFFLSQWKKTAENLLSNLEFTKTVSSLSTVKSIPQLAATYQNDDEATQPSRVEVLDQS